MYDGGEWLTRGIDLRQNPERRRIRIPSGTREGQATLTAASKNMHSDYPLTLLSYIGLDAGKETFIPRISLRSVCTCSALTQAARIPARRNRTCKKGSADVHPAKHPEYSHPSVLPPYPVPPVILPPRPEPSGVRIRQLPFRQIRLAQFLGPIRDPAVPQIVPREVARVPSRRVRERERFLPEDEGECGVREEVAAVLPYFGLLFLLPFVLGAGLGPRRRDGREAREGTGAVGRLEVRGGGVGMEVGVGHRVAGRGRGSAAGGGHGAG